MKSLDDFKKKIQEAIVDTSDYKLSPSGRKVRAHRVKVGDEVEDKEIKEASISFEKDPPFVLVLRRKAIRMYPNQMKVAIYHNDKLNKFFSVPYGTGVDGSTIQAEEIEIEEVEIQEGVMDQLHKIVDDKQANTVKFANGKTMKVDHFTASAVTQVHKHLNDENKKKLSDMVHKSPEHLSKAAAFAFKHAK